MVLANERDLLNQANEGDTAAFGELVRRHQATVFNVAYRLLGRQTDAEDAAQEAFLRAYQALDRFDPERPFAPWIKRITVNVCLNWLESAQVKPQLLASDLGSEEEEATSLDQWAHPAPNPEQTLVALQRTKQVRQLILELPPRYRAVIELRHFQEMSYEEMAEALERPLSSVKSDLFRARKMLAGLLKGEI